MPHSVASHLGLHSLPKTHDKGTMHKITDLKVSLPILNFQDCENVYRVFFHAFVVVC